MALIMMTLTGVSAADTGEIQITNINTDGRVAQKVQETTYEFMVFGDDNRPIEKEFEMSGLDTTKIKSYDQFTLEDQESITVKNLPAGSRVEISPVGIAPQYTAAQKVYKADIEAGQTARIDAENSVLPNKYTGFYPYVTTKVEGDIPLEARIKYQIELKSAQSGLLEFQTQEIESDFYGSDLFDHIQFEYPGTYTFEIKPVDEDIPGLKLDKKTVTVTATVTTINENYEINIDYDKDPVYIHEYVYPDVTYSPLIEKEQIGDCPESKSFEFTLDEVQQQDGVTMPKDKTLSIKGGETGHFDPITFTKPGSYAFTLTEKQSKIPGFTFDQHVWNLSLNVLSQLEGLVIDDPVYSNQEEEGDKAVFTNVYHSGSLIITKKVLHSDFSGPFSFTVKLLDAEDNPLGGSYPYTSDKNRGGTVSDGSVLKIEKDETVTISKLPAGAKYQIDEQVPPGFVVHSNNSTGVITENQIEVEFRNSYEPEPVEYLPRIKKSISGDPPSKENFHFSIERVGGNADDVIIPEDGYSCTMGDASGKAIKFLREGSFDFRITEDELNLTGYRFDSSAWNLHIEVEAHDGTLMVVSTDYTLEGNDYDEATFVNEYKSTTLTISKEVTGRISEEKFKFEITLTYKGKKLEGTYPTRFSSSDEDKYIKSGDTIELGHREQVVIRSLPEGASYAVREIDIPARYSTEKELTGGILDKNSEVLFRNEYKYDPVAFVPKVKKTIDGNPGEEVTFMFTLTPDEDNPENDPVDKQLKAECRGEGETSFDEMRFSEPGNYVYTITEDKNEAFGYVIDESIWELRLEILDEGTGVLTVKNSYVRQGDQSAADRAEFVNLFAPQSITYAVNVEKEVVGDAPESDVYEFELTERENYDSVTMPEVTTILVTGKGKTSFAPITFSKAGSYVFTVSEIDEKKPGYTYDKTVYDVTVEVGIDAGALVIKDAAYVPRSIENAKALVLASFSNIYSCGSLEVSKIVPGGSEDTFTFTLSLNDTQGNPVEGKFPYRGNSEGEISNGETFTLKDGEHVEILELPEGINYLVTETQSDSYKTESSGESGQIQAENRSYAQFTNTKIVAAPKTDEIKSVSVPKTGDNRKTVFWIILLILVIAAAIVLFDKKRKNRRDRKD